MNIVTIIAAIIAFLWMPYQRRKDIRFEGLKNFGKNLAVEVLSILSVLLFFWAVSFFLEIFDSYPGCAIAPVLVFLWFITRGIFAPLWIIYEYKMITQMMMYAVTMAVLYTIISCVYQGSEGIRALIIIVVLSYCAGRFTIGFIKTIQKKQ